MVVVHIAAIPQEQEQRCVRCCKKILDIDPGTGASFSPLVFVAVEDTNIIGIQETDAILGEQARCTSRGGRRP